MYDFWDYLLGALILLPWAFTLLAVIGIFIFFGLIALMMAFPGTAKVLVRSESKKSVHARHSHEEEWQ